MDINAIRGESFRSIGRAVDMCWLSFGQTIKVRDHKGNEKEKGAYALHLQCPWRIIDEHTGVIVMASSDIYEPNSKLEWSEEFEWDVIGNNLFDEKAEKWNSEKNITCVSAVKITNFGDIEIRFSNGFLFNSFMNISLDEEGWRFLKCDCTDSHMVGTGTGIKFE